MDVRGAYRGVQYSPDPFYVIDTAYYVSPKTELDMRWLYYAIQHYKLGEIDDGSPIPLYQGKRPITLYAWDLDCLVDVMTDALATSAEYLTRSGPGYEALLSLRDRLARLVVSK